MKIKMRTLACGPGGTKLPGHVYDVSDQEGKALAEGGYADVIEVPKPAAPARAAGKSETAARSAAPENAAGKTQNDRKPADR